MSPLSLHQVHLPVDLSTTSLNGVTRRCWWNSEAAPLLVDLAYSAATSRHQLRNLHPIKTTYTKVLADIISAILKWNSLPKKIRVELANGLLDFDRNMREFVTSMALALVEKSRINIEHCISNVVMTADGHIDRQQTIARLCFTVEQSVEFRKGFSAFYCVGKKCARKIVYEMTNGFKSIEDVDSVIDNMTSDLTNPDDFWETKYKNSGLEDSFFVYVAAHGTTEALQFFGDKLESSVKQKELTRAAEFTMASQKYTCEKLLFFFKHMSEQCWSVFLKRHFTSIFEKFLASQRYRLMCSEFYDQIKKNDRRLNLWALEHVCQKFTSAPKSCFQSLEISDAESILRFVWKNTPAAYKKEFGHKVFKIVDTLLSANRCSMTTTIIFDDAFDDQQRKDLLSIVLMNFIIRDQIDDLHEYILRVNQVIHPRSIVTSSVLNYDNVKLFIALSDNCRNVEMYDKILNQKCICPADAKCLKRQLLLDNEFICTIIEAIKDQLIKVEDFQKLLLWLLNNAESYMYKYISMYMIPKNQMRDLYWNHFISTGQGFEQINGFGLSQSQVQSIIVEIQSNQQPLFDYCLSLILKNDHASLGNMLAKVFNTNESREQFLLNFFESTKGVQALYNLIIEGAYDKESYCAHRFRGKLREFLDFKRHWVLSDAVVASIDMILQLYGHPNAKEFKIQFARKVELLPHESERDLRIISDSNYRIFRCLMRDPKIADVVNRIVHSEGITLSPITQISIMYGLQAGVDVPVIL